MTTEKLWQICLFFSLQYHCIVDGQMTGFGSCPTDLNVVKDFNLTKYLGEWYEQYRYFVVYQLGASCVVANYTNSDDGALEITNSQYNKWDEKYASISAIGKFNGAEGEAKFLVEFPNFRDSKPAIYWILGTDYTSYSVVWSCENTRGFHLRYLWILTREKEPTKETINQAINVLKNERLSKRPLTKTDQNTCSPSEEENDDDFTLSDN